jgi:hypothetical protein
VWIFFSTGVRLDYSCHHFAQAGDVDLQIKPEVHYKPEVLIISVLSVLC